MVELGFMVEFYSFAEFAMVQIPVFPRKNCREKVMGGGGFNDYD